jgi:hypothetical protein
MKISEVIEEGMPFEHPMESSSLFPDVMIKSSPLKETPHMKPYELQLYCNDIL